MAVDKAPTDHVTDNSLNRYGYSVDVRQVLNPVYHKHQGVEVLLPHSGHGSAFYEGWSTRLYPGDLVIGQTSAAHGSEGKFSRTVIHFAPDLTRDRHHLLSGLTHSGGGLRISLTPDAMRRVLWVARELRALPAQGSLALTRDLLELLLTQIEIARSGSGDDHHRLIRQIIEYMQFNVVRPENLDVLAERFGLSRGHMTDLFVSHVGQPPGEYWLGLRLDHACKLLETRTKISDVALTVGFDSRSGFNRAFKRRFGMSPTEYQAMVRESPATSLGMRHT